MRLSRPFPHFPEMMSKVTIPPVVMPERLAATDPFKQIDSQIGSGPFIYVNAESKPGEKHVYIKNPKYKPRAEAASGLSGGKVVKVDRVEWITIADQQTQVNALLNGEIDLIEIVPPDLLPLMQKDKNIKIAVVSRAGRQYAMRFNVLHKPFDNAKVRQAVLYALDQKPFLDANVGDPQYYRECRSLFPCGSPLESTRGWDDKVRGNVGKARELLKEAGYDGSPVVLMHQTDTANHNQLATVAKPQLEAAVGQVAHLLRLVPLAFPDAFGRAGPEADDDAVVARAAKHTKRVGEEFLRGEIRRPDEAGLEHLGRGDAGQGEGPQGPAAGVDAWARNAASTASGSVTPTA